MSAIQKVLDGIWNIIFPEVSESLSIFMEGVPVPWSALKFNVAINWHRHQERGYRSQGWWLWQVSPSTKLGINNQSKNTYRNFWDSFKWREQKPQTVMCGSQMAHSSRRQGPDSQTNFTSVLVTLQSLILPKQKHWPLTCWQQSPGVERTAWFLGASERWAACAGHNTSWDK